MNNFRLLFDLRTVSVGVILTRSEDLKDLFRDLTARGLKPASSFGESTTHWGKLVPRLEGGAGGGCPILAFGITRKLYEEDVTDEEARQLIVAAKAKKTRERKEKAARLKQRLGVGASTVDGVGEDDQDSYDDES